MKRALRLLCVGAMFASMLILVSVVSAHERRTIGGGKYDVEVGWLNEPTVVKQANGATIEIKKAGTEDAVTGVEKTLKVQIAAGGKDEGTFDLHTVSGKPGLYAADYTPPVTGSYIFTFTGTIEGTTINERFESGPGRFDDAITAEEAAKITPQPDEDNAATEASTAVSIAPSPQVTQTAAVSIAAATTVPPATASATPGSDATVAIVIVGVIVVLVAGGLIVIRRKP
jgi:hypothetical protein